ncbi:hypothetical protein D3C80_1678860 [compost metagenome]
MQIRSKPVEYRHEIVADYLYSDAAQLFNCFLVVVDIQVPSRQAELNVLMNVNAFNYIDVQAGLLGVPFHLFYPIHRPFFACRDIMQRPDDAVCLRNLLDVA